MFFHESSAILHTTFYDTTIYHGERWETIARPLVTEWYSCVDIMA
jgi:hypothetical protein